MSKKLDIEIELPNGTLGLIHIEEGDDPEALARLFIAEQCIGQCYVEPLAAFIREALMRITTPVVEKPKRTVESMNEASARLSRPFSHQASQNNEHMAQLGTFTRSEYREIKRDLISRKCHGSEVFDRLYNSGLSTMKKRQEELNRVTELNMPRPKSSKQPNSASERLYKHALEKNARIERNHLENKRLQEELPEECTFKPAILGYSKRLTTKDHVIQRLTVNAPTAQKAKLDRLQKLAEAEILKECTFKPELSTTQEKDVSIKAQYKLDVSRNGASIIDRLTDVRTKVHSHSTFIVPTNLSSNSLKTHINTT